MIPDCGPLLERFGGKSRPALRRTRGDIGARCRLPDLPTLLAIDAAAEANVAPMAEPATVYRDSLLAHLLVVAHAGRLWLCPPRQGGWAARMPLTMTDEAQAQRLRPARDVSAEWLGVPDDPAQRPIARAGAAARERAAADASGRHQRRRQGGRGQICSAFGSAPPGRNGKGRYFRGLFGSAAD